MEITRTSTYSLDAMRRAAEARNETIKQQQQAQEMRKSESEKVQQAVANAEGQMTGRIINVLA